MEPSASRDIVSEETSGVNGDIPGLAEPELIRGYISREDPNFWALIEAEIEADQAEAERRRGPKVYSEAYITKPEPKRYLNWCCVCGIPVVEGNMVVSTYSYQGDIEHCQRQGWGHPPELVETAHEGCLSGERVRPS